MEESFVRNLHALKPQPSWPTNSIDHPRVTAVIATNARHLHIVWVVEETEQTFRAEVHEDGGPCWQDSCVELFVSALDGSDDYCNFEFNALGFCLAACGPNRHSRTTLTQEQYAFIKRTPTPIIFKHDLLHWKLEVSIPAELLKAGASDDLRIMDIRGNLYKCGDKTLAPHWLSAFPIDTPQPDFHRPEFFKIFR